MASLLSKGTGAIGWSAVSQVGRKANQLLTLAILVHFLSPSDFGRVGMAMVVVDFAIIFRDLGTAAAIIQRGELSETLLNTVFWTNAAFGLLVTVTLFGAAHFVAAFFYEPQLVPLLQVLSLTFLISSLSAMQQALLERKLAFKPLAKLELAASLASTVVAVAAAAAGLGVWSLIAQAVTLQVLLTIFLWFASHWRPSFRFSWMELRFIAGFSLNVTAWQVMNYLVRNADNLLIGRYLGSQALGYYSLAYRVMLYPLQAISGVVNRVLFPVYSRCQDNDVKFRGIYTLAASGIAIITFPMMTGVMVLRVPFVAAVFGQGWEPVAPLLLILAPLGLIQSLSTTVGTIYLAKGKTNWMLRWGIGSSLASLIAFTVGLRWGVIGVASGYFITNVVLCYPSFAIPFHLIKLRWLAFLRPLMAPALASVGMGITIAILQFRFHETVSAGWLVTLLAALGSAIYALILVAVDRERLVAAWRLAFPPGVVVQA